LVSSNLFMFLDIITKFLTPFLIHSTPISFPIPLFIIKNKNTLILLI
jgi:hypothetical protein